MRHIIWFDGDRIKRVAGVELGVSDVLMLAGLATIYSERFKGPPLPNFMLDDCDPNPKEHAVRRAFMEEAWRTWSDCRRRRQRRRRDERRRKQRHNPAYGATDNHFLNLMLELFAAIGEKPSIVTLRHDLQFLKTGRERSH